ncbi:MAG: hypothetical protein RLZZ536_2047 [Planctomycetota bacterium]|jgi:hypothetical protein
MHKRATALFAQFGMSNYPQIALFLQLVAAQVDSPNLQRARFTKINRDETILRMKPRTQADQITCLDNARWNPENLLYGENALAALTFCDVVIDLPYVRKGRSLCFVITGASGCLH